MTVKILYNNLSETTPKGGARRVARRWADHFRKVGIDVEMRALDVDTNNDIRMLFNHGVDMRSRIYSHSLVHLIIYDDEVYGKYITNESEEFSYEDVIGMFVSRKRRKVERQLIYEKLYAKGL